LIRDYRQRKKVCIFAVSKYLLSTHGKITHFYVEKNTVAVSPSGETCNPASSVAFGNALAYCLVKRRMNYEFE
jgi:hypothetical protein